MNGPLAVLGIVLSSAVAGFMARALVSRNRERERAARKAEILNLIRQARTEIAAIRKDIHR